MNQHVITIAVTLTGDCTPEARAARLAEIADAVEECIDDKFSPDNGKGSIEAPFRFDRTPAPFVSIVTSAVHGQPADVHPWANIADSPSGIAAHLAKPQSARTVKGVRTSQLHLRDVGDGWWSRVRLVTVKDQGRWKSTLHYDHHKQTELGDFTRDFEAQWCPVRSVDAKGQMTPHLFELAHEEAAKVLVAYPEAIEHLLGRAAKAAAA